MPLTKYFCEELLPEIEEKATKELGESEKVREESLKILRHLIQETPDFYPCMDDSFLLRFLRFRKYDVEQAFKYLKDYYIYKAQYSGIFTDILPSQIKNVLDNEEAAIMEHRLENGAGLFVIRTGYYDPDYFSSEGQLAFMLIATEVGLEVEATQITGYSALIDFHNWSFRKTKHFCTPKALYRILTAFLKSMPCRIKSCHVVNEPVYMKGLLNVIIHLLPRKFKKRLHWHGSNLESLHTFISPEFLPEEFGGLQGSLKNCAKKFGERVLSKEEYFKKMSKYGYRENDLEQIR